MDRTEFVIAYMLNDYTSTYVYCLSCKLQRKNRGYHFRDFINRSCKYLVCATSQIYYKFNNTKHIPIITVKGCKHPYCSRNCDYCVITYRHNVRRV